MDSYIQDTSYFLRSIEDTKRVTNANSIIGTMDVSFLYTNIPNNEGITSISELLELKHNKLEKPSNDSFKLLQMVLKKNNFQFNVENYLQIGGTVMATKVAPSLASLCMLQLKKK